MRRVSKVLCDESPGEGEGKEIQDEKDDGGKRAEEDRFYGRTVEVMKKDSMNPYMTEAERMLCCRWRKHVTGFAGKCVVREKHMLAPNVDAFDLLAEVIVSAVCNDAAIRQMAKKRSDTKRRGMVVQCRKRTGRRGSDSRTSM